MRNREYYETVCIQLEAAAIQQNPDQITKYYVQSLKKLTEEELLYLMNELLIKQNCIAFTIEDFSKILN